MVEFKLTQKQESFCLAYIETGNASEAYRRVYDAEQMMPSTVTRKAAELMDNPKIVARLRELREPAIVNAQITLESHLAKLAELRDAARLAHDYGAAIRAEIARGKAASLYAERLEVKHEMTLVDIIEAAGRQREVLTILEQLQEQDGGDCSIREAEHVSAPAPYTAAYCEEH